MKRAMVVAMCVLAAAVATAGEPVEAELGTPRPTTVGGPPPNHHVFVINLENKGFETTFGAGSPAPYLASTLTSQGAFLRQYYGIGHASLTNYIAQISGQAPTPTTQADCHTYVDVAPGTAAPDGQVTGDGCVYPAAVTTLTNQLTTAGMTWKGYMQDMGNNPARESATCAHPTLGAVDNTQGATATDQYATRHNPFVYFHSIIDNQADCDAHVVSLNGLSTDLQLVGTTPNLTYITPSLCDDGHDAPCADGRPGGLVSADAFLQTIVPQITGSPAYQQDGMLVITFDESDGGDSTACCNEQSGPNTAAAGGSGPGGGRVGAVILSPFVQPGTVTDTPYNHYALLRSIEDIFGLSHLGYAARNDLTAFGSDVYTRPPAPAAAMPVARVAGATRIDTAVAISKVAFPADASATAVVLARADQFPDALAGGPLAAQKGGPLLLTAPGGLDASAETELSRVLPTGATVYLLGGPLALSTAVETQVQNDGYLTQRLSGDNRYSTAVAIAQAMGSPSTVFEATGLNFPDALAGVSPAITSGGVILLTDGATQAPATALYLAGLPSSTRYALGGQAATADPTATAFVGADRFQTATMIASHFFPAPSFVGGAPAASFPDALGAGPYLGTRHAPLLLLPTDSTLPTSVSNYLTSHAGTLTSGTVFGGSLAVSEYVRGWVAALG